MPETRTKFKEEKIMKWAKEKNLDVSNQFALLAQLYKQDLAIEYLLKISAPKCFCHHPLVLSGVFACKIHGDDYDTWNNHCPID